MTILPQLERDLRIAAGERLAADDQPAVSRHRRSILPPSLAALATLAGAAVALAVALLAIVLAGRQPGHPRPATPSETSSAELHRLTASFAVLRRPQTAADRAWEPVWQGPAAAPVHVLLRFTRLATKLPDGARVFLTVGRIVSPDLGLPLGTYLLDAWVVRRGVAGPYPFEARAYVSGAPVLSRPSGLRHSWFPAPQRSGRNRTLWVSIVPDRIAAVAWEFVGGTVLTSVVGNVAAAVVARPRSVGPQRVVWYGPHGKILDVITVVGPLMPVLYGNGVGVASFGERVGEVESRLNALLGRPVQPFSPNGACGVAGVVQWQDLAAFFKHGRFVGYSYGGPSGSTSSPVLATARGVRIGTTIAQASRMYGSAFHISEAQGGTWSLATPTGLLDGFAQTRIKPHHGDIGPRSTIATIQAGSRICGALAP